MECQLDEHLKFTGKTSDQRKCSRSSLTEAYVEKRVSGKKGSTTKYHYRPASAGEKSNVPWDGLVDLWRCGCIHCLHLVWLPSCKTFKSLSLNVQWFRVLGALFSSLGCSIFETWVLRALVVVFERFVFETSLP